MDFLPVLPVLVAKYTMPAVFLYVRPNHEFDACTLLAWCFVIFHPGKLPLIGIYKARVAYFSRARTGALARCFQR